MQLAGGGVRVAWQARAPDAIHIEGATARRSRSGRRRLLRLVARAWSEVAARATSPPSLNAGKRLRPATVVGNPLGDHTSQVPVLLAQHLKSIHQRSADTPEGVDGLERGEIFHELAADGCAETPATLQQAEKGFRPRRARRRRQRTFASSTQGVAGQGCFPPLDQRPDRPGGNGRLLVVVVTLGSRHQRLQCDLLDLGLLGVARSMCQCLTAKPGMLDRQRHCSGCGRVAWRNQDRTITGFCWRHRVDPHSRYPDPTGSRRSPPKACEPSEDQRSSSGG